MLIITKPAHSAFTPYYHYYVDLVGEQHLLEALETTQSSTQQLLSNLSPEQANYRYQPDKWSIKEVLTHLIDTEMIFNYRALRFARGDRTELPGYDHDAYVRQANGQAQELSALSAAFFALRQSTIQLFKGFDETMIDQSGIANGKKLSVRAIGFLTVGHEIHHLNIIKTNYLK